MKFKNSPAYVQRQTDLMLKDMKSFAKIFINDIIIFSRIREDHLQHLKMIFEKLNEYEITLNSIKIFLEYLFLILLKQIVDALNLITAEKKLAAISKLIFSKTFKDLKTYLSLTK